MNDKHDWQDVSDAVGVMTESLNDFHDQLEVIYLYLSNLDASDIKKSEAEAHKEAVELCGVIHGSHVSLCEHSVNLFNNLQQTKKRIVR